MTSWICLIMSAIFQAKQSGTGQIVDVAMYDSIVTLLRPGVAAYGLSRKVASNKGRATTLMPFGLFPAKDGKVAIAAPQPNHWENLCEAMARPDLLTDERTRSNGARVRNQDFTEEQISAWTLSKNKREVLESLGGKVPVGSSQNMAEIFDDPHVEARNMINSFTPPGDNPEVAVGGYPIKFSKTPSTSFNATPLLDQHRQEILEEFGIRNIKKGE